MPELPPLTALRAFEAAARHLSFTLAARELFVTQTAISHQVKQLEAYLGAPLFRRLPRRLELTADGVAWARELRDVFGRLYDANRRLRARGRRERPIVAVSVIPSFASAWLVPRLGRFLARHPGFDLRISAAEHLVDFAVEPIDVGIRYGRGPYPGLVAQKLADDALVVVCAPSLRARKRLASPADLKRHVLLHDDEPDAWRRWLDAHAVRDVDAGRGAELTDSSMLVAAAVRGQGVALARRSLAFDDLAGGRLVLAFPRLPPLPTGRAYYVVSPRANLSRPPVTAFRDWLVTEAAALRD
jgi:LysR family transcriptional regulator, glycine cleavage system transcriptional activator